MGERSSVKSDAKNAAGTGKPRQTPVGFKKEPQKEFDEAIKSPVAVVARCR